jgi:hypothetical protein
MERIVFKSLAKSNVRYVWYRSGYNSPVADYRRSEFGLGDNCGWYDTFNDGDVQHSSESPVMNESATDYLASLLAHIASVDAGERDEMLEAIAYDWPNMEHKSRDEIVFAINLEHKSGKTRYYNLDECKISSAESKRHDKRWEVVSEYIDGSPSSAFRLLHTGFSWGLKKYALADKIADVWREVKGRTITHFDVAILSGMESDSEDWEAQDRRIANANNLSTAFNGINLLVKSYRYTEYALRCNTALANNYVRNVLNAGELATA